MSNIDLLARQLVRDIVPYESARRIGGDGDIWLNANEAPDCFDFTIDSSNLNRYPEFQPQVLINAYATYSGLATDQILATRGADEGIELLIRTFCEPATDKIAICPPTYGMYSVSSETCGVAIETIALDENLELDFAALKASNAKLFFLCAPNNPTGNMIDHVALVELAKNKLGKAIIVVDEAYIEFSHIGSTVSLIADNSNIVVLRTLSKAFGLASLRCGFTLASAEVINLLAKVIPPYPVPGPVAQIAIQALSEQGIALMQKRVSALNIIKQVFAAKLNKLSCVKHIFSDNGNFLLIRFDNSPLVFKALSAAGIIARDFNNKPRLENCIRITIGSESEMAATLDVLTGI